MKTLLKFKWFFTVLMIIVAVTTFILSPNLSELAAEKGDIQLPDGTYSEEARQYLESVDVTAEVMSLVLEFDDNVSNHTEEIEAYIESISELEEIENVTNPFEIDEDMQGNLINDDNGVIVIPMEYTGSALDILEKSREVQALNTTEAEASLTSHEMIQKTVEEDAMDGIRSTEIITLIVVVAVLLIMFRSLVTPFVPVIVVGLAYLIGQSFVAWFVDLLGFPISPQTQSFLIVILFGIGTDYCILLLNRFKEELVNNDKHTAILNTFRTGGKTVFISGLSGAIVFAVLYFANFEIYRSAVGVAVGIVFLLIALYTVLPTLMALFGKYIFWPNIKIQSVRESKLWSPLGLFAINHPTRVIFVVIAILIGIAVFYDDDVNFNAIEEISDHHSAVHATNVISENFDEGQLFPVEIYLKPSNDVMSSETMTRVETIAETLSKLDEVKEVQTFTRPTGERIDELSVSYQLGEMSDGVTEVQDGLSEMEDGLNEISEGLEEIQTNLTDIEEGLTEVSDGLGETSESLSEGAEPEETTEAEGEEVAEGEGGLQELQGSVEELSTSLSEINNYLQYSGDIYGVANQLTEVQGGLDQVSEGLGQANEQLVGTGESMGELAEGLSEMETATSDMSEGLGEIVTGLEELTEGLEEITSGLGETSDGLNDMDSYINAINENNAVDGSGIHVPSDYIENDELKDAVDYYILGDEAVKLDVILSMDPYSEQAMEALDVIETTVESEMNRLEIADADVYYAGVSSINRDLEEVSSQDYYRVVTIFMITLFVILAVLFRSFILPIYMIGSIFVTYFASVTITSWLLGLLGIGDFNWAVPFFSLIIFAALGIDYSIFIIDRFTEELRHQSIRGAIETAVRKMGVVVITAVIILSGTFAALYPSGIIILIQVASIIIFALLFYAFIVLPLLIPAFVITFGRGNWWPFRVPHSNEKKNDYYSW